MKEKTEMKTVQASVMIVALLFALSLSGVSASTNLGFGGKSGDWTEYSLENGLVPSGEMLRMEFLNVAGTNVTVNATAYTTTFTEISEIKSIDLASNDSQNDFPLEPWFNARVYFIPAGLNVSDSVYLGQGFGAINITGDTTRSYAGADREVIYANFSQQEYNYVFYWDKQTGVLTEGIRSLGAGVTDVLISETSMWGWIVIWWIWILVAIAIALGILTSRKSVMKKLRRKPDAPPTKTKPTASFHFSKGKS